MPGNYTGVFQGQEVKTGCMMHHAYKGEMAEWLKAPLSKSGNSRNWVRGFESHSLRFSKLTAAS